ncbi:MAG: dTMP kinase [Candidatus Pacebacteria bacterium]|nr:dTMP kinase [Candidatus Paceibacterota bacterium]
MKPGFFILEGCEAAGKTTQLKLIEKALTERGYNVLTTHEPGGTAIGEGIRTILLDPAHAGTIQPFTNLLLFNASRHQWMKEVVMPALAAGKIVIGDRSFLSTMVYQSYVEGLDAEFTKSVCVQAMGGVMPDKIFLLDLPVEEIRRRLSAAAEKTTRYDVMDDSFHAKVREGYLAQIEKFPGLIEKMDGMAPVGEISDKIVGDIIAAVG